MDERIILVNTEPRGPSQLIEVQVPVGAGGRVNFPDIQQLRSQQGQDIIIKAMRLITAEILTNGVISGLTTAPLAELQKIALVLYCEGWEKAQYIPILTLHDVGAMGSTTFPQAPQQSRFANWRNVDWSKSYLQYANTTAAAGTPYVVMFDVEYVKLDAQGHLIVGPS